MTTKVLASAPFAQFQTLGASYIADARGVIAAAAIGDVIDLICGGCVLLPSCDNLSATSDPSASNDNTQGYTVGLRWVNTAARRLWTCISAATGAAAWALAGLVPGIGAEPANISTLFGGGTGMFLRAGNLYRSAGNPLAGNNADTTDDLLASYTLPASSFDAAGRGLCITAQGSNRPKINNKRVKLWFNATVAAGVVTGDSVIADTGLWINTTTPNNNVRWQLTANLFKFGATGSNTQHAQGTAVRGGVHGGTGLPVFPTALESSAIVIALTGSSYTTGAANDVIATWFEVNAIN